MARTSRTTATVEAPDNVVELEPGVEDQAPVEQPDEAALAGTPGDQPDAEQLEPQFRSRGFALNEVRLIGRKVLEYVEKEAKKLELTVE